MAILCMTQANSETSIGETAKIVSARSRAPVPHNEISANQAYPVVRSILIVLVLLSALCAGLHTVADYDMGWQLATGRYVVQHHQIPRTDVLSFTSAGKPWIYPPFAGVLFYLTYCAFGYGGLSWFCALTCVGIVAYLVRRKDFGSVVLTLLAVQSIAARTAPRADLFSTVFFAFFLGELWAYHCESRSRLWLLPVLMLFWVNLHPGFIAGLAAIGAYLFIEVSDLLLGSRRQAVILRLRRIWPWLVACGAAALLNPWGPRIFISSLTLSGLAATGQGKINSNTFIGEFKGVPLSSHLFYQLIDVRHMENGFTWLLLIALILAGIFLWKRELGAAVIVFITLYFGLAHARYIGIFVITVATLGGSVLRELFIVDANSSNATTRKTASLICVPAPIAVIVSVVFCAVALLHVVDFVSGRTYVVFSSDWRFGAGESSWLPDRAAAFIRREQLPGNIFEDYSLGGYAVWALGPQYPDFLDGRGDRLSPDLVVEQRTLYSESPDSQLWKGEADRWNLNVLLVATSGFRGLQKMDPFTFCRSSTWRPVYMDDVSLVFLRDTQQNRPWINRLQIDCGTQELNPPDAVPRSALYDFYLNSGALFFELHRDQESQRSLRNASALYPEDPNAHLLLASLFRRQRHYREAEQEYRASLALNENSGTRYSLGLLYAGEGRDAEALQAIERAANESTDPLDMYMALGKLQIVLNHPEPALTAFGKAEKSSPFLNGGESLAPELYAEIAEGKSEAQKLLSNSNEAIAFQREAIRDTPSVASRWIKLADLYEATGQMHLAAEARTRAAELQTANASR
jgi:tetratricopeptide (TPR) repeat protein